MRPDLIELVTHKSNAHIDPTLHIWGWEIALYLFLGGLTAGLLVLPALLGRARKDKPLSPWLQWMPLVGLLFISLGMGALFLDLEHKRSVWRFYLALRPSSPMSWGAWILLAVYPAGLLLSLASLDVDRRARASLISWIGDPSSRIAAWSAARVGTIRWFAVAVGAGLGLYTGLLLGTLGARLQWSTALLGPLFLTGGLSTGAAFMLLFPLDNEDAHTLLRWDLRAIAVELALIGLMVVGFASGDAPSRLAAEALLGGAWTASFWSLVVVLGLLVPLTMEALELRGRVRMSPVTPVLILIGGLALRAILLAAGQESGFRLLP